MYLIDKKVYFNPLNGKLFDLHNELLLGENAKECLSLLIEFQGEVVSKDLIVSRVWNAKGIIVSDNAVRQTMHILRRAFQQFTADTQIITTIPRTGYMIVNAVQVPDDDQTLYELARARRSFHQRLGTTLAFIQSAIWPGVRVTFLSFFLAIILSFTYVHYFYSDSEEFVSTKENENTEMLYNDTLPSPSVETVDDRLNVGEAQQDEVIPATHDALSQPSEGNL